MSRNDNCDGSLHDSGSTNLQICPKYRKLHCCLTVGRCVSVRGQFCVRLRKHVSCCSLRLLASASVLPCNSFLLRNSHARIHTQSRTDVRYGKRYFQGRYSRKTQWEEPTEPDMPPGTPVCTVASLSEFGVLALRLRSSKRLLPHNRPLHFYLFRAGLSKKKLRSIPRSQRAFTNKPKNSMVDRVHEARRMPAFGIDRAAPFAANVYDPYYHGPREYVQRFNNVPPDVITLSGDLVAHGVRPYVDDSTYSDESSREESLVNFATMHDHRV